MRVVLDTNILVSAVLGGRLAAILDAWEAGQFTLLVNTEILREYRSVLARPKFGLNIEDVDNIIGYIFQQAEFVTTTLLSTVSSEDPADDKFLKVALTGQADCIVSGDNHLLRLKACEGIPIYTAREFLARLGH